MTPFLGHRWLVQSWELTQSFLHYVIREVKVFREALKARYQDKQKQNVRRECCQHSIFGCYSWGPVAPISLHSFIVHYFIEIYNLIDFQFFIKLVGTKFLCRHNSQINGYHILSIILGTMTSHKQHIKKPETSLCQQRSI